MCKNFPDAQKHAGKQTEIGLVKLLCDSDALIWRFQQPLGSQNTPKIQLIKYKWKHILEYKTNIVGSVEPKLALG